MSVDLANNAGDVLILCADNFSDIDMRPLIEFHRQHDDRLTMVLFRASQPFVASRGRRSKAQPEDFVDGQ